MSENPEDLLTTQQAVEYLKKRWGLKSYNVNSFRQYRYRRKIKPSIEMPNASMWRRGDLDQMPRPDVTKRSRGDLEDRLDSPGNYMVSYA